MKIDTDKDGIITHFEGLAEIAPNQHTADVEAVKAVVNHSIPGTERWQGFEQARSDILAALKAGE